MNEHLALTSLRDGEFFPSFLECPHETEVPYPIDSDYYEFEEEFSYPIAHRCFLGEITESVFLSRLCLIVKDRMGKVATVRFHLESNKFARALASHTIPGMPYFPLHRYVPESLTKKGNTIASLYAMRHDFPDGPTGFRIENSNHAEVGPILREENLLTDLHTQFFPCTLERLLALSDRISASVSQPDDVRACHKCNATASQRCSGCHVTWYCGKVSGLPQALNMMPYELEG
jgi:hypothetical protein